MKLIVTGVCGFIGSHFAEMAIKHGYDVVGIDAMMYSGRMRNLDGVLNIEGVGECGDFYFVLEDICNASAMRRIFKEYQPDAIVHLAAESHVARSIESREEFLRTNVMGTNALLEESLAYWKSKHKVNLSSFDTSAPKVIRELETFLFLHVSTDEVYGSLGPDEAPWTEDSPYLPNNAYSASKAASDHLVRSYHHTYGLPTIITHAANNYGSRQHPEKFIPTMIRQCMNGEPMTLHGDGKNIRDWLHVEDHCRGLLLALEHGQAGHTYNFGGECERTNEQIAKLIAEKTNHRGVMFAYSISIGGQRRFEDYDLFGLGIRYITDRAGNDRRYSMNISKADLCLDWRPQHTIEDAISDVVNWYLDNPNYGEQYGR